MQNISNETFNLLRSNEYVEVELTVEPVVGSTFTITNSDIIAGSFSIDRNSISGDEIEIGNSETSELKFTLDNYDKRFTQKFEGANITVVFKVNNELIPAGYFIVDSVKKPLDTIEIAGLDYMAKFNKIYVKNLGNTATAFQLLNQCCIDCGVQLFNTDFTNSSLIINVPDESEKLTYHEVVSYVAELAGDNAYISFDGKLHLNWYGMNYPTVTVTSGINTDGTMYINWYGLQDGSEGETDVANDGVLGVTITGQIEPEIDDIYLVETGDMSLDWLGEESGSSEFSIAPSDRFSKTDDENEITITGILCNVNDNEYLIGTDTYSIVIDGNPLINDDNVNDVLNVIFQKIGGFKFTPFNFTIHGFPHVFPMDKVQITDSSGNVYYSYIMTHNYTLNGLSKVSCKSKTETESGYASSAPFTARQKQIIKVTSGVVVEEKLSTFEQSMFNFNELMTKSIGYYETIETDPITGASIRYIHDNPDIYLSMNIYRQTELGFSYTNNGGYPSPVWQSGMTSDGNILAKVLDVVGINAEWINTGDLNVGGSGRVGNIRVKDAGGSDIILLNQNGITLADGAKLISNGGVISTFKYESMGFDLGGFSNSWGNFGIVDYGGQIVKGKVGVSVYIPTNFTVISANIFLYAMPVFYNNTTWRQSRNLKFYRSNTTNQYYNYIPYSVADIMYSSGTDITSGVFGISSWSPSVGSGVKILTGNLTNYLSSGSNYTFHIQTTDSPDPANVPYNHGLGKILVFVTGYTK